MRPVSAMRTFLLLIIALIGWTSLLPANLAAQQEGALIFSDDFNREESTPDKEEIGNGWTTNSAWRAPGKKQVDLRDGALHGGTHPDAGHALVLFHPAGLRDGAVEFRFLIDDQESIGVEFADPACKTVHAGHLCSVRLGAGRLTISDLKTGNMDLKIRERRLAGEKSDELDALLKSKSKAFPVDSKPRKCPARRMCPVEDTGMNSVRPSSSPRISASAIVCSAMMGEAPVVSWSRLACQPRAQILYPPND